MPVDISNKDELQLLFGKAFWIESILELALQWEAYMTMGEKHRDLLFTIAHDSETHSIVLRELCSNIEGLDLEKETESFEKKDFDLSKMIEEEIFTQMLRYELLALDIYTKLHNLTNKDFLTKIWKGENINEYFNKLKWLIKEEERHRDMLKPLAGRVARTSV